MVHGMDSLRGGVSKAERCKELEMSHGEEKAGRKVRLLVEHGG